MDKCIVVVLGDGGVGKTALTIQFVYGSFVVTETYDPTIEDAINGSWWWTANCASWRSLILPDREYANLRDQWVRAGDVFILLFSIDSRSSFDRLEVYREAVHKAKGRNSCLLIVGNKSDKVAEREVPSHEGRSLAQRLGCEYIETSAKRADNVDRTFAYMVRALRDTKLTKLAKSSKKGKCIVF